MTGTPTSPKANAVKAAMSVTRAAADANLDADALDLLTSGLAVDRRIVDGDLTPDAVDAEITTGIIEVYENVARGNAFWPSHLRITEQVLEALSVEERTALWHRTNWADIVDDRTPELPAPAPVDALAVDQVDTGVDGPPSPQSGAEAESDATEVVDAEIIEDVETTGVVQVGQTTSAQRRYSVPPGTYGPNGYVNPTLSRSIEGGRRHPQITVDGEAAGWS